MIHFIKKYTKSSRPTSLQLSDMRNNVRGCGLDGEWWVEKLFAVSFSPVYSYVMLIFTKQAAETQNGEFTLY